ncbi:unnamed protein product [Calypogeia fissa]
MEWRGLGCKDIENVMECRGIGGGPSAGSSAIVWRAMARQWRVQKGSGISRDGDWARLMGFKASNVFFWCGEVMRDRVGRGMCAGMGGDEVCFWEMASGEGNGSGKLWRRKGELVVVKMADEIGSSMVEDGTGKGKLWRRL